MPHLVSGYPKLQLLLPISQNVRLHIHLLLRKIHVVPDHILRLIQGFVDHLILRPFKAGKVVSIHHKYDGFLPRAKGIDK